MIDLAIDNFGLYRGSRSLFHAGSNVHCRNFSLPDPRSNGCFVAAEYFRGYDASILVTYKKIHTMQYVHVLIHTFKDQLWLSRGAGNRRHSMAPSFGAANCAWAHFVHRHAFFA